MKTLKYFLAAVLAVTLSVTTSAQTNNNAKAVTVKTEQIKVSGNCESCKARIEKAAKVDGVAKVDWNMKTKMLTMVYNPTKVTGDKVQKMIAAAGHDTPMYKADSKVYASLPGCCKYR